MTTAVILLLAWIQSSPAAPPGQAVPTVADDLYELTDAIGPRVAGSDAERQAQLWVMRRLRQLGTHDVRTEVVPAIDVGDDMRMTPPRWAWRRCVVQQIAPWPATLVGVPALYSPSTPGPVRGRLRVAPLPRFREADVTRFIEGHRGHLAGAFLLLRDAAAPVRQAERSPAGVHSDEALDALAVYQPDPPSSGSPTSPSPPSAPASPARQAPADTTIAQQQRLMTFLRDQGVLGLIGAGHGAHGGAITPGVVPAPPSLTVPPPVTLDVTPEHFNRLLAFATRGVPAELDVDVDVSIESSGVVQNVLADIPGGDRANEVVIVGAHLDSLHGATGATDNAAGVVAVLEAARLLTQRGTPLRRTVRLAFWSAEELGLQGSRAYVRRHLQDAQGKPTAAAALVSAYFNIDYGGGRIRGLHLQGRRPLKPLFDAWFGGLGGDRRLVATLRQAMGSDQASFERAGIPGLSFVQDPLDYETRTHHTTMDGADYVAVEDVVASAHTLAAIIERVANAPDLLPRSRN